MQKSCLHDPAEEIEIAAFDRLKPVLADLWDSVFPGDEEAYTSVIVPSLTLDPAELAKLNGGPFYEERLLFLLMRLRNPRARVVYVTSQPVHPLVLDYYLQLLMGIPASHARNRLTLLCVHDNSARSLTEKILERPRLVERIRASIPNPARAYLTVYNSTPLERRLAVRLGIPMNAPDPRLTSWGSKSGSRKLFREAGIDLPLGYEDLRSVDEIESSLLQIHAQRPDLKSALLKLEDGFSGEGNARFDYPEVVNRASVREVLGALRCSAASETGPAFLSKFEQGGGIVEEMLEAVEVRSPSVQLRINPRREVIVASTHEQLLGGPQGQVFLGCLFPADDDYRQQVQQLGIRVGEVLAGKGVIGRFSVDFLATRNQPVGPWRITALEINLRMGGTTHPMLALRFLTGGDYDRTTGLFRAPDGQCKYYRASDNVQSDQYLGLLPEDLVEIVMTNHIDFNHRTGTGVLFHMIGAASQFGKFGMIAIGNSRDEAENLFARAVSVLDHATLPKGTARLATS